MKVLEYFHIYNQKEHVGIPRMPKPRLGMRQEQQEDVVTGGNLVTASGSRLVCHPSATRTPGAAGFLGFNHTREACPST